jgi:dolichyl-phosphate beta-glucosyltransferase
MLLAALRGAERTWEVLVVDDGSDDGTADVVRALAAAEPRLRVLVEPHRGKGGAVRAGMLAARGRYRFLCDADFSMPVTEMERFLPPYLHGYDIAIGTREGPGAVRVGEPSHRHFMGRVFNGLIQLLLLPGIEDSQCGFKCFTDRAAEFLFSRAVVEGFAFDVEVLYLARQQGLRIAEVPITWHYMDESSVKPIRDTWSMGRAALGIRLGALLGRYR